MEQFTDSIDFTNKMYRAFYDDSKGQRIGQFAYNYFREYFVTPWGIPESVDCFNDDKMLSDFLWWIANNWNALSKN